VGNPSIRVSDERPPAPASTNGILALVSGDLIAQGSNTLPPPGPHLNGEHVAVVQVPDRGAVRITYRLDFYRHRKSKHYHWRPVRADAMPATDATGAAT
jgi:hypothetical protein